MTHRRSMPKPGCSVDGRALLRPVRLRDRLGPVPDLVAAPRRVTALLQREVRLLRAEPVRRRRERPQESPHLQLGQGHAARADPGRHRDAARHVHLRGPARARPAPRPALPGVHASQDGRHRAEGPRVLRPHARSAGRRRRVRLHHPPRRPDADAHHRHAAGDPRGRPGGDPRPDRRRAAHRGRRDARRRPVRTRPGPVADLRRLHRLAGRQPLRRPDDRDAPGGVRGRRRRASAASPARRSSTTSASSPPPATRPRPG